MRSTFMGLETSKRGMFTQQSGLYTTGHNLSNANTLGYSRQRVNMEATRGFPGTGLQAGTSPGFIGTGVGAHSVQRSRDEFVDRQFRQEANGLGYWDSKSKSIMQMEDVLNEPSDFGINSSLDVFWKSINDVGTNPQDIASRKVVIERGVNLAESFNYTRKQLTDIQGGLKNEIDVSTNRVNSLLKQIATLNDSIKKIEVNGHMPNDLYDSRDVLLDELTEYFPIEVKYEKNGGNALAISQGNAIVSLKTPKGLIEVVNGKESSELKHNIDMTLGTMDAFQGFTFKGGPANGSTLKQGDFAPSQGKMLSLINSYGYGTAGEGDYPQRVAELDNIVLKFAEKFNEVHRQGFEFNSKEKGKDFFIINPPGTTFTAENIRVNPDIIADPNKLAASSKEDEAGNGENALLLAGVKAVIEPLYKAMIADVGVKGEQANRLADTSLTKLVTISNSRASVSSVSVDEEMTNMITFQQAYNASARMMTAVDETLDRIINGMGRVGQ